MITLMLIIVAFIAGWKIAKWEAEECPRNYYGYECKGDRCDHSEVALLAAKLRDAKQRDKDYIRND